MTKERESFLPAIVRIFRVQKKKVLLVSSSFPSFLFYVPTTTLPSNHHLLLLFVITDRQSGEQEVLLWPSPFLGILDKSSLEKDVGEKTRKLVGGEILSNFLTPLPTGEKNIDFTAHIDFTQSGEILPAGISSESRHFPPPPQVGRLHREGRGGGRKQASPTTIFPS